MAQHNRISRRDLKDPDQFMVTFGRVLEWCRLHRQNLIIGGVAVFVILIGFAGWQLYDASRRESAQAAYNRAVNLYQAGQYAEALERFREVQQGGSTAQENLAAMYVANSQLALGATKEAIRTLEELKQRIPEDAFTSQLASLTLGLSHELAKDCGGALRAIEGIVGVVGPFQQEALLLKARCSVNLGQLDSAIEVYRDYLQRYPGEDTAQISLRLQELQAKSAGG